MLLLVDIYRGKDSTEILSTRRETAGSMQTSSRLAAERSGTWGRYDPDHEVKKLRRVVITSAAFSSTSRCAIDNEKLRNNREHFRNVRRLFSASPILLSPEFSLSTIFFYFEAIAPDFSLASRAVSEVSRRDFLTRYSSSLRGWSHQFDNVCAIVTARDVNKISFRSRSTVDVLVITDPP